MSDGRTYHARATQLAFGGGGIKTLTGPIRSSHHEAEADIAALVAQLQGEGATLWRTCVWPPLPNGSCVARADIETLTQ